MGEFLEGKVERRTLADFALFLFHQLLWLKWIMACIGIFFCGRENVRLNFLSQAHVFTLGKDDPIFFCSRRR